MVSKEDVEKMTADAEKYAKEDADFKEKVEAKNALENYCYSMKNTLDDDKVKGKISEDDKKKATDAVDEGLKWLEGNQMAEKEEFEHKRKEIEGICTPIMTAMYSQIDVTFDIDANGMLNVSALEKSTGKENKITITNDKSRLSKEDVEKMTADAEKYAKEDADFKE